MPRRTRSLLATFAAWTVFVWINRLANAWSSTTETTGAKVISTVLAAVFLAFAVATGWIAWRTGRQPLDRVGAVVLQAFAAWTASVWLVRLAAIVLADHSLGFKLVHAGLAVISVALAVPAWRAASGRWSSKMVTG